MNRNILNYWIKYHILLIFNIYKYEFNINIKNEYEYIKLLG